MSVLMRSKRIHTVINMKYCYLVKTNHSVKFCKYFIIMIN